MDAPKPLPVRTVRVGITRSEASWDHYVPEIERERLSKRIRTTTSSIEAFAQKYCSKNNLSQSDGINAINDVVWYEAVHACRWLSYSVKAGGSGDFEEARLSYNADRDKALLKAVQLVDSLADINKRYGYWVGHAIKDALEIGMSSDDDLSVDVPDMNTRKGFHRYRCSSRTRQFIELQMISRIGLFESECFLESLTESLHRFVVSDRLIERVGPLRLQPGLSAKAYGLLETHTLGLAARLAYRFREYSAGRGVHPYYPGLDMPRDGKPCWHLIADIVNAVFRCTPELTENNLRQRWMQLKKGRSVKIDPWPDIGLRQSERVRDKPTD